MIHHFPTRRRQRFAVRLAWVGIVDMGRNHALPLGLVGVAALLVACGAASKGEQRETSDPAQGLASAAPADTQAGGAENGLQPGAEAPNQPDEPPRWEPGDSVELQTAGLSLTSVLVNDSACWATARTESQQLLLDVTDSPPRVARTLDFGYLAPLQTGTSGLWVAASQTCDPCGCYLPSQDSSQQFANLWHFDGNGWQEHAFPTGRSVEQLWVAEVGSTDTALWALSRSGTGCDAPEPLVRSLSSFSGGTWEIDAQHSEWGADEQADVDALFFERVGLAPPPPECGGEGATRHLESGWRRDGWNDTELLRCDWVGDGWQVVASQPAGTALPLSTYGTSVWQQGDAFWVLSTRFDGNNSTTLTEVSDEGQTVHYEASGAAFSGTRLMGFEGGFAFLSENELRYETGRGLSDVCPRRR